MKALLTIEDWNSKFEITIVGSGPQFQYFQDMADNLGLCGINWLGSIPHSDVGTHMDSSDLLVHPSIHEAGCAVVLEAFSRGLPVISHDAFGMAFEVDDKCGIKLSYIDPETSTLELAEALQMLYRDPVKLKTLSEGAYLRAKELSWDCVANEIEQVYCRVS